MTFENLNLSAPILKAIAKEGYTEPTPIQAQAIPVLLAGGDVLGSAQTGTGKTAAYAIPIIQQITKEPIDPKAHRYIKSLILTPTRELAVQIKDSFVSYGAFVNLRTTVVYGGVSASQQISALKAGVDILVATPGRLLDLMNRGFVDLANVKFFVLDEADEMLDMGFINDIKKIIAKIPEKRQTMLFSATMPGAINVLAQKILTKPVRIAITPVEETIDAIDQIVYCVSKPQKINLLYAILKDPLVTSALVFSRTKHGANKIVKELTLGGIEVAAIHGNKSQVARQDALNKFKSKKIKVLIATDIAARGIDINQLSHVINYDLPEAPELYIHRIGRTGRAGLTGSAISFYAEEEKSLLTSIQRHIGKKIPTRELPPFAKVFPMAGSNTGKDDYDPTELRDRRGGFSAHSHAHGGHSFGNQSGGGDRGNRSYHSSDRPSTPSVSTSAPDTNVGIDPKVIEKDLTSKAWAPRSYPPRAHGDKPRSSYAGNGPKREYSHSPSSSYVKKEGAEGSSSYPKKEYPSHSSSYPKRDYSSRPSTYVKKDGDASTSSYPKRDYSHSSSYVKKDGAETTSSYGKRDYSSRPTSSYPKRDYASHSTGYVKKDDAGSTGVAKNEYTPHRSRDPRRDFTSQPSTGSASSYVKKDYAPRTSSYVKKDYSSHGSTGAHPSHYGHSSGESRTGSGSGEVGTNPRTTRPYTKRSPK